MKLSHFSEAMLKTLSEQNGRYWVESIYGGFRTYLNDVNSDRLMLCKLSMPTALTPKISLDRQMPPKFGIFDTKLAIMIRPLSMLCRIKRTILVSRIGNIPAQVQFTFKSF